MRTLNFFLFFLSITFLNAQITTNHTLVVNDKNDKISEKKASNIENRVAHFPTGEKGLMEYIYKNLKYPELAEEYSVEGMVFVRFAVYENGEIDEVDIVKGLGFGCDEAVVNFNKKDARVGTCY